MKIIDRNGRLFGKISIIDLVVIAVVIVMAFALYVKTNHNEITSTTTSNTPITYQMLVRGVRTYVADAVRVGDHVYDQDRNSGGGSLGVITDIEIQPGAKLAEFKDGTIDTVPVEDGVDMLLTIQGEGLISEGRYVLNRVYDLGVNSSRNFCTMYAQFTGSIYAILS